MATAPAVPLWLLNRTDPKTQAALADIPASQASASTVGGPANIPEGPGAAAPDASTVGGTANIPAGPGAAAPEVPLWLLDRNSPQVQAALAESNTSQAAPWTQAALAQVPTSQPAMPSWANEPTPWWMQQAAPAEFQPTQATAQTQAMPSEVQISRPAAPGRAQVDYQQVLTVPQVRAEFERQDQERVARERATATGLPSAPEPPTFRGTTEEFMGLSEEQKNAYRNFEVRGEGVEPDRPDYTGLGAIPHPKEFSGSVSELMKLPESSLRSLQKVDAYGTPYTPEELAQLKAQELTPDQRYEVRRLADAAREQGVRRELQIDSLKGARQQLREGAKAIQQRLDILPSGYQLSDLKSFVKQAGYRVGQLTKTLQKGENLSRSEGRFMKAYDEAVQTLNQVQQTEAALAEVPIREEQIDQQLKGLASLPPPDPQEVARVFEARFMEANMERAQRGAQAQTREAAAAASREAAGIRQERTLLRQQLSEYDQTVRQFEKEQGPQIEDAVFQQAIDHGLLVKRQGRYEPRDEQAGIQYETMIEQAKRQGMEELAAGFDPQATRTRLAQLDQSLLGRSRRGAAQPTTDQGEESYEGIDEDAQILANKHGVSIERAREALLQAGR